MVLLPEHCLAALAVAGDGEGVGDVVADQLTPHGSESSEVFVWCAPLLEDTGGDKEGVGKLAGHPQYSCTSHTCNRRLVTLNA